MYQDQDASNSIVVWGTWDSRGHFESHLAWRTERGENDILGTMLDAPPSMTFLEPIDA